MNLHKIGYLSLLAVAAISASCSTEVVEVKKTKNAPLVELSEVKTENFKHNIIVQGNVNTDQDILISPEASGELVNIKVKEGQRISKGQTIATIDNSILNSNAAEIQTQLDHAEYILSKQEELHDKGVGSEFDLRQASNQVASLKAKLHSLNVQNGKTVIKAPFTGIIDKIYAKNGELVSPQTPIARLVNNSTVDITASLSEKHYAKIHKGTEITVTFPNYLDTMLKLKISHVGNYIDPTNRTFNIMTTLKNNTFLLPNMLAQVEVTDISIENGLVIPTQAIMKDQNNNDFVYVASINQDKPDSTMVKGTTLYNLKKQVVKVVSKYDNKALINSQELTEGNFVVTKGAKGITELDKVRTK